MSQLACKTLRAQSVTTADMLNDLSRNTVYQQHPSADLNTLFRRRPFQGADPDGAEFLFVGLDANYAADLQTTPVFRSILEYHADGISFWRRHGVHHPFLLPTYKGDGKRYHQNFARIGFTADDAERVSFLELLHVPTVGRSKLEVGDLASEHMAKINSLVTTGAPRHAFLSASVTRLMVQSKQFGWLCPPKATADPLPVLYSRGATKVYLHLHFSNYGRFQARLEREALAIARVAGKAISSCR